nr:hypothetical protein [Tanacetum cinerariifolium]
MIGYFALISDELIHHFDVSKTLSVVVVGFPLELRTNLSFQPNSYGGFDSSHGKTNVLPLSMHEIILSLGLVQDITHSPV